MTEAEKLKLILIFTKGFELWLRILHLLLQRVKLRKPKSPDSFISIVVWNVHLQNIILSESSGESCDVCERAITHLVLEVLNDCITAETKGKGHWLFLYPYILKRNSFLFSKLNCVFFTKNPQTDKFCGKHIFPLQER